MSRKWLLVISVINCFISLTRAGYSGFWHQKTHNLDSFRLENSLTYDIEKNRFHSKHSKILFKSKGLFCPTRKCNHQPNKFNSEFECNNDKMCPKLHKCCYHGCYAHKVCVKGADNFARVFSSSENEIRVRHKLCPPSNACTRTVSALSEDYHCFSDKNCDGGHKCCSHSCYIHKVCVAPREIDGSKSAVIKYPSDFSLADLASVKVLEAETISTISDSTVTSPGGLTTKTKHGAHKSSKKTKKVTPTSYYMTTHKNTLTTTSNKKDTKQRKRNRKIHTTDATVPVTFVPSSSGLITKSSDIKFSTSSDVESTTKTKHRTHKTSKKTKKVKPTSKMTTYKKNTTTSNKKNGKKRKENHKQHTSGATEPSILSSGSGLFTKSSDRKFSTSTDIGSTTKTKHQIHKNSKKSKKVKSTPKMTTKKMLATTPNKKSATKGKGNRKIHTTDATTTIVPFITPSGLSTETSNIKLSTVLPTPQVAEESTSHDTSTGSVLLKLTSSADTHEKKSPKHKNNKKSTKPEKIKKNKSTTVLTSSRPSLGFSASYPYSNKNHKTKRPPIAVSKAPSNSHSTIIPNSRSSLRITATSSKLKVHGTEYPSIFTESKASSRFSSTSPPKSSQYRTKGSTVPTSKASLKFYSTAFVNSEPGTRGPTVLPNSRSSLMFSSPHANSKTSSKFDSTLYPDTTVNPTFDSIISNSKESSTYDFTVSVTPLSKASSRFDSTVSAPRFSTSPGYDSTDSPRITTKVFSWFSW